MLFLVLPLSGLSVTFWLRSRLLVGQLLLVAPLTFGVFRGIGANFIYFIHKAVIFVQTYAVTGHSGGGLCRSYVMLEGYARSPACRKHDATETLTKTQKDIKPLVMRTKAVTLCIKSRDKIKKKVPGWSL